MSTLIELQSDELLSLMQRYQEEHTSTPAKDSLDYEIEQRAYEQLAAEGENGWDFCTVTDFFGDYGTSILIQNTKIDWKRIWDWLVAEYPRIPDGAIVNFEVWDNIQEGRMVAGEMLVRRLIIANGCYEEAKEEAEQVGTSNGG